MSLATPSPSTSGSVSSQTPSASRSGPSFATSPPDWFAPVTLQSSQPSASTSRHRLGLRGAASVPSSTPSLSLSVSTLSGVPSPSVSGGVNPPPDEPGTPSASTGPSAMPSSFSSTPPASSTSLMPSPSESRSNEST